MQRFSFFASLPAFTDVEGVLTEMTYAVDQLGAVGVVAF